MKIRVGRVQLDPACRAYDPELWFPIGTTGPSIDQVIVAKSICAGCPLRIGCLEFALEHGIRDGIWGGRTPEERRDMRGVEGGGHELVQSLASA